MTTTADRTTEALFARRALAEKATPGPWLHCFIQRGEKCWAVDFEHNDILVHHPNSRSNIVHITANTPDVVMADIDEILRLRAEVERLEREADWLAQAAANAGWGGVRVGPRYIREAARKAVEESQCKN